MDRHELMRVIALATGLSLAATGASEAGGKGGGKDSGSSASNSGGNGSGKSGGFESKAQGYENSGNPKAAGGPDNPGVGNPHTYKG